MARVHALLNQKVSVGKSTLYAHATCGYIIQLQRLRTEARNP